MLMAALIGFSVNSNAATTTSDSELVAQVATESSSWTITVKSIKRAGNGHAWIKVTKKGVYDDENETVIIDGRTYRVYENDLYKQVSDERGNYRYVAYDCFYFNL